MPELPEERPETTGPVPSPVTVVWQLLRADDRRAREGRDEHRAERSRRAGLGADVARVLHDLRRLAAARATPEDGAGRGDGPDAERVGSEILDGLNEKLDEALRRAAIRVEDPTGRVWTEVRDWADPLPGGPGLTVADLVVVRTVRPGVWLDDELIERAHVEVGRAPGRPETDPAETDPAETDPADERDDRRDRP